MIHTTKDSLNTLLGFHKRLDSVILYLQNNRIEDIEEDFNVYIAKDIFYNCFTYETKSIQELNGEVHKKYYDLHIVVKGEEIIDCDTLDLNLNNLVYDEFDSCVVELNNSTPYTMNEGSILLIPPLVKHMPKIKNGESHFVKKIVFKILV
ncbi:MAG: YhcH/YjgK/YiaL family protein [Anaerorhabdus sp.]